MSGRSNDDMRPARLVRVACAILLANVCAVPAMAQKEPPAARVEVNRAQLEKRLAAIATLLESSSAARQVEASGDARALEKRSQARDLQRQAQAAFQAGDELKAHRLLNEASVLMFAAVRLAAPEQVTLSKQRADFDARMESVKALLAAQQRIGAEKTGKAESAEATRTIEKLIQEANQLAAAGSLVQARTALDRAYLAARGAIRSMREGDTLVRSLNFANKEEEYRYEVDRNDTHRMLIRVLLEGKPRSPGQQSFIDLAQELRAQAEAAAAGGDHAGAVRLLEDSTRELVRAIRGAGVYIPG